MTRVPAPPAGHPESEYSIEDFMVEEIDKKRAERMMANG